MNRRNFEKYRRRNPARRLEPAAPALDGCSGAAVIPVLAENGSLEKTLDSLVSARGDRKIAFVCVVNCNPASTAAEKKDNAALLDKLRGGGFNTEGLCWLDAGLLKYGVGEARKLGFDALLHGIAVEAADDFIFYSCDADAPVDRRYFAVLEAAFRNDPAAAAVIPDIRHGEGETPELELAIRRYEKHLHDYLSGLRSAGSPYAYLTIGSAMSCRASCYVEAGGMRKRLTGEDFYFLEAVAKNCGFSVRQLDEILVHPSPRLSRRVPVGTGTRLEEMLSGKGLPVFPPDGFAALRRILAAATPENLTTPENFFAAIEPAARDFLEARDFPALWRRAAAATRPEKLPEAFNRFFDALVTLQFLRRGI